MFIQCFLEIKFADMQHISLEQVTNMKTHYQWCPVTR